MDRPNAEPGIRLRGLLESRVKGILLVSRTVVARAASIAAAAILSVVVARVLGPTQAGVFFVLMATLTGAATLGRLGTDNMALKWIATASKSARSQTIGLFWICTGASTVAAIPVFGLARWILKGHLPSESLSRTALIAAVSILPAALSVTASAILRGVGKVASGTIAELGAPPAIATGALLAYSFFATAQLEHVVCALALGNLLTALWSVPLAARELARDPLVSAPRQATRVARLHGRQLFSMMGTSLLFYLLTWSPVLILGAVSTSAEIAYFNVAARIAAFITLIPSIQSAYLTPQFAMLHYRSDIHSLNHLIQKSTRRAVLVGGLLAVPIILFPSHALLIFGSDFAAAQPALRVLTAAAIIVVAIGPVNGLLLTCGFEHFASLLNGVSLTLAVGAMLVVAPIGGAPGVALVSGGIAISYAAVAATRMRKSAEIVSYIDYKTGARVAT